MTKTPEFEYSEELGLTTCILKDKITGREFIGVAQCHDDDMDMCNEKTGCEIAFLRATIEFYKYMVEICNFQLQSLKQLYYSMNLSKKFSPKSYEAKMLYRQIKLKEEDLELARQLREDTRKALKNYLSDKDVVYNKIRSRREFYCEDKANSN